MPYILTHSGRHFRLASPSSDDVDLGDISHALARINRFTGHAKFPYSVAQHSVAVARYLHATGEPLDIVRAGLLHDAHEAYFGDVSAPLKRILGVGKQEDAIQAVVADALNVPLEDLHDPRVCLADRVALAAERAALLPADWDEWPSLSQVTPEMVALFDRPIRLRPEVAQRRFEQLFAVL